MNNKKLTITLMTLSLASVSIITMLAFLAKNTNEKNGFNRRLLTATLKIRKEISLPVPLFRIIGSQPGLLYYQDNSAYSIYKTTTNLDSFKTITLPLAPDIKLNSGIRMFLNGEHVYISCKSKPAIIDYHLNSGSIYTHVLKNFYSNTANLANGQFIFKIINLKTKTPQFIKLDLQNKETIFEDDFSPKEGENVFTTDGFLYYDSITHQACYTYLYRNGFITMDTNLHAILKARTIDTVTQREIKIAHVGSSYTMKQPPKFVNFNGNVAAGNLYLQSMLKGDNEFQLDFTENTAIDIYSLKNGAYKGSFYIPPYKGKKPINFNVIDNRLYVLYGKSIVLYDLDFPDKTI